VATQVLPRRALDALPCALDVVRAARTVHEAERRPDGLIAAKDETIARAREHRLHAAPVGLDARRARVVETAAVNRAPEVRIELEVGDAPLAPHRAEDCGEVLLHCRVCAVEHVPRAVPPAAESDAVGAQRLPRLILDKPI